ncbi:MAG: ice-binding family protein [Bacteroidales bacterium]|nr:ice-binding family protein [Bacteroidales bacterium]
MKRFILLSNKIYKTLIKGFDLCLTNALYRIILSGLVLMSINPVISQTPLDLGNVSSFVLFSSNGSVLHSGQGTTSNITGNIGCAQNYTVSGFGNINGNIIENDTLVNLAAADLLAAYNAFDFLSPITEINNLIIADTLAPGIYKSSGLVSLVDVLAFDALGDTNACFFVHIDGSLYSNTNAQIVLLNGAKACNVFWKIEGPLSLADSTKIKGTVLVGNSNAFIGADVTIEGRVLSTAGEINIVSGLTVTNPDCGSCSFNTFSPPYLGGLECFALFTSSGNISNTGVSIVDGKIGNNSNGTISGYDLSYVAGTIHNGPDVETFQADIALQSISNFLDSLPVNIHLNKPDQFGKGFILRPCVYNLDSSTNLTDTIFFDALGNSNAVCVINIEGDFNVMPFSNVVLLNGANFDNIFWNIKNGHVSIRENSSFKGNIIAENSTITINQNAVFQGRALTISGNIYTIETKVIYKPAQWTGIGTNNSWFNPENWRCGLIPNEKLNAVITNGPLLNPVIKSENKNLSAFCKDLLLEEGMELRIYAMESLQIEGASLISGNLIIEDSAELVVLGDLIINETGNFQTNNSIVIFSGLQTQIISSNKPLSFYNIVVDKPNNGKIILGNGEAFIINNSLHLKRGELNLNNRHLIIENKNPNAIIRDNIIDNGFICVEHNNSNFENKIIWTIGNSLGSYIVPFGRSYGEYIPFEINITSNLLDSTEGKLEFSTYGTQNNNLPLPVNVEHLGTTSMELTNSNFVTDRFWYIGFQDNLNKSNVLSPIEGNLSFTYLKEELNGVIESQMMAQRYNSNKNTWTDIFYTIDSQAGYPFLTGSNVNLVQAGENSGKFSTSLVKNNDFGNVWVLTNFESSEPLPLELLFFNAECYSDSVSIEWATATETNVDTYIIEKSIDGSNWLTVGKTKGSGTSSMQHNYYLSDQNYNNDITYYRLTQYDFDGQFAVFAPVVVSCNINTSETEFSVFPNPFSNSINITFENSEGSIMEYVIYDVFGNKLIQNNFTQNDIYNGIKHINTSLLPKGNYILKIRGNELVETMNIVKLNN